MLKLTRVFRRPDINTPWYVIPNDLYNQYVDKFIYTGELLSQRLVMSDDQLEMTAIAIFQDEASVDKYFSADHPFYEQKRAYEIENGITVSGSLVEPLHDTDPYLQEFLFDFSIVNHSDSEEPNGIIHDAAYLFVEQDESSLIRTHDPAGPAW